MVENTNNICITASFANCSQKFSQRFFELLTNKYFIYLVKKKKKKKILKKCVEPWKPIFWAILHYSNSIVPCFLHIQQCQFMVYSKELFRGRRGLVTPLTRKCRCIRCNQYITCRNCCLFSTQQFLLCHTFKVKVSLWFDLNVPYTVTL